MPNSPNPDPRAVPLAGASAVAPELCVECANLELGVVVLSDGAVLPITNGLTRNGERCRLNDRRLYSFVFGSDERGWSWDTIDTYSRAIWH